MFKSQYIFPIHYLCHALALVAPYHKPKVKVMFTTAITSHKCKMQETLKPRLQVGYTLNQNISNEKTNNLPTSMH